MMSSVNCKSVTIFEGPDCGGKTTTAREYATQTGALYFHHGPYKGITTDLARLFFESMLPALHGFRDVVLDRCWISEPIYGFAFRRGEDRVGPVFSRMLERAALRCGAVVVTCRPPWETVKQTFLSRRDEEYLEDVHQLESVYEDYRDPPTELHEVEYDYTAKPQSVGLAVHGIREQVEFLRQRTPEHRRDVLTSGNVNAPTLIVGDSFGNHKNGDPLLQLPFQSFNRLGCSAWLTQQLIDARIPELSLQWINADQLKAEDCLGMFNRETIALGDVASAKLSELDIAHDVVPHPQYWKRFRSRDQYPLIPALKKILCHA